MDTPRSSPRVGIIGALILSVILIIIALVLRIPEAYPFVFEHFMFFEGAWYEPLSTIWWLFAFGALLNAILMLSTVNPPEVHRNAHLIPIQGFFTSAFAGVFEELTFRWVFFYAAIVFVVGIDNAITALLGFSLIEMVSTQIILPVANILSAGQVQNVLFHPLGWSIGIAALLSTFKFQQGHLYQGWRGWIFSWYGSMAFFLVMFNHGLLAAIFAHFLFDLMVFAMLLVDVALEKAFGNSQFAARIYKWY